MNKNREKFQATTKKTTTHPPQPKEFPMVPRLCLPTKSRVAQLFDVIYSQWTSTNRRYFPTPFDLPTARYFQFVIPPHSTSRTLGIVQHGTK